MKQRSRQVVVRREQFEEETYRLPEGFMWQDGGGDPNQLLLPPPDGAGSGPLSLPEHFLIERRTGTTERFEIKTVAPEFRWQSWIIPAIGLIAVIIGWSLK